MKEMSKTCRKIWVRTDRPVVPSKTMGWRELLAIQNALQEGVFAIADSKRPEFFESHGFTKDDRRIIFTANSEPNQDGLTNDIYTYELATGQLTNLTHSADYDEHAQLTPSGNQIIWMSSRDLPPIQDPFDIHADYWIMNVDGSNPRRVSRFAERGRPDYVGPKVIAADSAWSPDGKRLAAYLILESRSQDGKIVFLDFDSPQ